MANTVKVTKMDRFNQLLALSEVQADAELVKFVENEIYLIAKKNIRRASEQTEAQKENAALGEEFVEFIAQKGSATIAELRTLHANLSPQKVAPIMARLEKAGRVVSHVEKRVKVYSIAAASPVETEGDVA